MTKTNSPSRLTRALTEMADDMRLVGILDEEGHKKITVRHLGDAPLTANEPLTGSKSANCASTPISARRCSRGISTSRSATFRKWSEERRFRKARLLRC